MRSKLHYVTPAAKTLFSVAENLFVKLLKSVFPVKFPVYFGIGKKAQFFTALFLYEWDDALLKKSAPDTFTLH